MSRVRPDEKNSGEVHSGVRDAKNDQNRKSVRN